MVLWVFWRQWHRTNGLLAPGWRLKRGSLVVFVSLLSSILYAKSAFQLLRQEESKQRCFEYYQLEHTSAQDYAAYSRALPCKKCRIVGVGGGSILTLIAANGDDLAELRSLVAALDTPKEQVIIALCCVLVQEHQVAGFLGALRQQPDLFYRSWQEGVVELATEMSQDGSVMVLATPKMSVQIGRRGNMTLHDETVLHKGLRAFENYGLALDLDVLCFKQGRESFIVDLNFSHQLFLKSQGGFDPRQRKEIKTQVRVTPRETVFLGSAGHIGVIQEQGFFNIFKILPQALWPKGYDQHQINSELIVLMSIEPAL